MTGWRFLAAAGLVVALSFPAAHAADIDVISVRQTAYDLNNGSWQFIRAVVAAKSDVKPLEAPAKAIARWATVLPTLFPPGSDKGGDTKALPAIWTDMAGFQKAAATMQEAATKLADDAKAGETDAVAADAKALGESCGACHRAYRAR